MHIQDAEKQIQFGPHTAQSRGDLLYVYFNGRVSLDEAKQLLAFVEDAFGNRPYYAITDVTKQEALASEVRRFFRDWAVSKQLRASAMIGATLFSRTTTILVVSAVRAFSKKVIPINFVADLNEAQKWIAAQRSQDEANAAKT